MKHVNVNIRIHPQKTPITCETILQSLTQTHTPKSQAYVLVGNDFFFVLATRKVLQIFARPEKVNESVCVFAFL